MKKVVLAGLMLVILIGCGTKSSENPTGEKPPKENQSLHYEETKENIKFTIKVNQESFDLDDEIIVEASVENVGEKRINYYAGSSTCVSHLSIHITSAENDRRLSLKPVKEIQECTDDMNNELLEPGETVTEKAVFIPKEHIPSSEKPVPVYGGTYEVTVMFRPEEKGWNHPITASAEIHIEGTNQEIISKEEAEQAANNHKEVQQWINNHSGEAIAKIENGNYFILFYDGWQKASEQEFERLKNGIYQEEKDSRFVDGKWEVNYLSKIGPLPSRIQIVVDGRNGEVLSVKTFER